MTQSQQANIAAVRSTDAERDLFHRELDSFVPDDVLDAHTHIWSRSVHDDTQGSDFDSFEYDMTLEYWRRHLNELMPGRRQGGLIIPGLMSGSHTSLQQQNEFVSREALSDPWCRPSMMVRPEVDADYARQEVRRLKVSGLKCYHTASTRRPTWDSDIPEYLTEEHVRIANEEELCITLHMVKSRGVADPSNQYWIRTYCEKYPKMKMILAHAARSFNPYHVMEGMDSLRDLPNLWCDMAAVSEVGACEAIIDVLGHEKLLWGGDFPVSNLRGRCVAIGDSFVWLNPKNLPEQNQPISSIVFHGLESLRVLKQAAWHRNLSDTQVEDIFFNNLARLLDIRR